MHLLLPLTASLLFVFGLIFIKRSSSDGVGEPTAKSDRTGPITTLFLANIWSALVFSALWLLGSDLTQSRPVAWDVWWQPALISLLYICGLSFTFAAVEIGDVSIAAPIFGLKVVFVAFLLTVTGTAQLPTSVWFASVLATGGIALIQWTGRSHPKRALLTIVLALSAASSFATFDVVVSRWAPAWGIGRLLPIVFWIVGLASLSLVTRVEWEKLRDRRIRRLLLIGTLLIALQALCITIGVAQFGDAARVNIVYALRGLWGVTFAWISATIWGGAEARLGWQIMMPRVLGAGLLTIAVAMAILAAS